MHTAFLSKELYKKDKDYSDNKIIQVFVKLVLHLWKAQNMGKSGPSDNTASNKQKCVSLLYGCRHILSIHILNHFLLPFVTIIILYFYIIITMFYIGYP